MTDHIAYTTTAAKPLEDWETYLAEMERVRKLRDVMSERFGRRLMVNRRGFGHGTRVVGFEVLEGEPNGLVIGDNGELRIPKKGPPYNTATPNLRRKAGKELADELATLVEPEPTLEGMPAWTMVGLSVLAPAIFRLEDALFVLWAQEIETRGEGEKTPGGIVDYDLWARIPLSSYYAAKEQVEK